MCGGRGVTVYDFFSAIFRDAILYLYPLCVYYAARYSKYRIDFSIVNSNVKEDVQMRFFL